VTATASASREQRPDFLSRFLSAVPLLAVYFGLAALYAWQASRRPVPTIFTDELELTQLARAIAETGEPARRGVPYEGLASLTAYVLAPVWWLSSATASWAAAKLILVLAMTATVFPAYGLARMVVPKWYALAAAGAAAAVPALAYAPVLVEEPLAYPLATLSLWLITRAYVEPSRMRIATAVVVTGTAMLTRTQLSILFAVFALGFLWLGWQSERVVAWRSTWSRWDWVGAAVLMVGIAVAFSAFVGHFSQSWRETTGFYRDRIVEHMSWAAGALAIGIGVLPLIAGIAALARPRDEPRDPKTRAFVVTSVASIVVFLAYTGIKGAFISTRFSTLVVERNLIYLCPILFAATALAIARGVGRTWAIVGAAVFTLWVVTAVPLRLGEYPYYEAHGLSMAALANRELGWPQGRIEDALVVTCVLALAFVLALRFVRHGSTAFAAIAAAAGVGVLAWTLTSEVYAAEGERLLAKRIESNLPVPSDWVERETGGGSVVMLGQQMLDDATGIWLTEFFNPSLKKVWSVDGTAPGPGAILTPDLAAADGTLTPNPRTDYAITLNGVELQAPEVARVGQYILYRVDQKPLKVAAGVTGVDHDGWVSDNGDDGVAEAAYNRFDVSRDGPGFASVNVSRVGACLGAKTAKVTARIGPLGIGRDNQPAIARVTEVQEKPLPDCKTNGFLLSPPPGPWRVEVSITPTFIPHELDVNHSDTRRLGATFTAGFRPFSPGG
jgi:hypothetical protein